MRCMNCMMILWIYFLVFVTARTVGLSGEGLRGRGVDLERCMSELVGWFGGFRVSG